MACCILGAVETKTINMGRFLTWLVPFIETRSPIPISNSPFFNWTKLNKLEVCRKTLRNCYFFLVSKGQKFTCGSNHLKFRRNFWRKGYFRARNLHSGNCQMNRHVFCFEYIIVRSFDCELIGWLGVGAAGRMFLAAVLWSVSTSEAGSTHANRSDRLWPVWRLL